jgi:hypothetical protein
MAYNAFMVEPPPPWPIDGIRETLAFLPAFEAEGFVVAVWEPPHKSINNGLEVTHLPYPTYKPEVERFWEVFSGTGGFINPYEPLHEDADDWSVRIYDGQKPIDLDYLAGASIDQVRRWLSLTKRGERFCDGHIESQFENGYIVAALKRIQLLIGDGV